MFYNIILRHLCSCYIHIYWLLLFSAMLFTICTYNGCTSPSLHDNIYSYITIFARGYLLLYIYYLTCDWLPILHYSLWAIQGCRTLFPSICIHLGPGLWFIGIFDLKPPWQIFFIDSNVNLPFENNFLYQFFESLWLENGRLSNFAKHFCPYLSPFKTTPSQSAILSW